MPPIARFSVRLFIVACLSGNITVRAPSHAPSPSFLPIQVVAVAVSARPVDSSKGQSRTRELYPLGRKSQVQVCRLAANDYSSGAGKVLTLPPVDLVRCIDDLKWLSDSVCLLMRFHCRELSLGSGHKS